MKDVIKAFIKVVAIILLILIICVGCVFVYDYVAQDQRWFTVISSYFTNDKESNIDVSNNIKSFTPAKEDLELDDPVRGKCEFINLTYNGDVFTIPYIPTSKVFTTFSDTFYLEDGSVYVSLSKGKKAVEDKTDIHVLNFGRLGIYEYKFKGTDTVMYIQCYTGFTTDFYLPLSSNPRITYVSAPELISTDEDIASKVSYPESLIPKDEDQFLDSDCVSIVTNNQEDFEGFTDFKTFGNKTFTYYRGIGFLDTKMRVEYARLTAMGYTPTEVGTYSGISYIKFKELTVLGYPITKNSSLIYHITE